MASLRTHAKITATAVSLGRGRSAIARSLHTASRAITPFQWRREAAIVMPRKIGIERRKNWRMVPRASPQIADARGHSRNVGLSMLKIRKGVRETLAVVARM